MSFPRTPLTTLCNVKMAIRHTRFAWFFDSLYEKLYTHGTMVVAPFHHLDHFPPEITVYILHLSYAILRPEQGFFVIAKLQLWCNFTIDCFVAQWSGPSLSRLFVSIAWQNTKGRLTCKEGLAIWRQVQNGFLGQKFPTLSSRGDVFYFKKS